MFDLTAVNKAIAQSFEQTADDFAKAQVKALEAEIYDWDGTVTYRKSGQIVSSPRDIVDTGELRSSLMQLYGINVRVYVYVAAHAADVHEGYITDAGFEKPARRWTKEARERYIDLQATFANYLANNL